MFVGLRKIHGIENGFFILEMPDDPIDQCLDQIRDLILGLAAEYGRQ